MNEKYSGHKPKKNTLGFKYSDPQTFELLPVRLKRIGFPSEGGVKQRLFVLLIARFDVLSAYGQLGRIAPAGVVVQRFPGKSHLGTVEKRALVDHPQGQTVGFYLRLQEAAGELDHSERVDDGQPDGQTRVLFKSKTGCSPGTFPVILPCTRNLSRTL